MNETEMDLVLVWPVSRLDVLLKSAIQIIL